MIDRNEQPLKPLKRRGAFSPVLIELTIVILFFALSTVVVARLIAAASATSNESAFHARAILAMESVAEETKANPEGDGAFDENGARAFTVQSAPDLAVDAVVARDDSFESGALYTITLSVVSETGETYTLTAMRYVPRGEAAP